MPFTGLANAAIDHVATNRADFAAGIARYAQSDLLCYRADGPEALVARQAAAWDPLLEWARGRYDVAFVVTQGVLPVAQPDETLNRLGAAVGALDPLTLAGLSALVTLSGSLICGLAIWFWVREPQDSRPVTPYERLDLSQMLRVRNIWLCCLISICLIANVVVLLAFLPLYLTSVRGYSTTLMSWVMSVAGLAGPFAFLVAALSDRIGRKPAMVVFSFAAILAPVLIIAGIAGTVWFVVWVVRRRRRRRATRAAA